MLAVKANHWSESAHRFLKLCADSGNVEACYTLGMVSVFLYQFFLFSNPMEKMRTNACANFYSEILNLSLRLIIYCFLDTDSILLFAKPREWSILNGQGRD